MGGVFYLVKTGCGDIVSGEFRAEAQNEKKNLLESCSRNLSRLVIYWKMSNAGALANCRISLAIRNGETLQRSLIRPRVPAKMLVARSLTILLTSTKWSR